MTNKFQDPKTQRHRKILLSLFLKLLAFAVLMGLFLFLVKALPGSITYDYTESLSAGKSASITEQSTDSTLQLSGNTLTIYSPGGEAVRQACFDASLLGEYDRQLLSSGIRAALEELLQLFEELIS